VVISLKLRGDCYYSIRSRTDSPFSLTRATTTWEMKVKRILVYICPLCGKKFEMHIHGEVFERKALYCSRDGELMLSAMEARNATSKAT
jgi:hypothetical protein